MEHNNADQSRETGARTWDSLASQMMEAGGFFGSMFRSFRNFVRKYFWSLLILAILGAAAGAGYWWMNPTYFKADMTVSYVHYEKKIYADMLMKLNSLLQNRETVKLAKILKMQQEDIKKVYYINSYNIRKEPLTEDISTEKIPFYIEVGVKDPDILPDLQQALVNYLDHTEFIQSRLDFMYRKTEEELAFLERRLAVADSLSRMNIIRNEGMNDEKTITRMELLEESMTIYARIQEVRGLQAFNLNIEVLDGFIAIENKAGRSLLVFILYGLLIGLAVRLLLLLFR